jgi:hypothetical protein
VSADGPISYEKANAIALRLKTILRLQLACSIDLYWNMMQDMKPTMVKLDAWANYEGESVNRSQMDIKRKTCDIRTCKKTFISWHTLHQHWYTCPITLPMHQNPQHRSIFIAVSATSAPPFPLHWSTLWFRLVVTHPCFNPSNKLAKHIFSFICIP